MAETRSVIIGTGCHIPPVHVPNDSFLERDFRASDGSKLEKSNREIVDQFEAITGIRERRYVGEHVVTSEIAFDAARAALESGNIDPESLDYLIVAHNFGDVRRGGRSDLVPSLAARVKTRLNIRTPRTVAFDLVFGCPGWLQGIISGDAFIRAGNAKRVMVIGAETLSRISDPHDRDSMIYADGAGATVIEGRQTDEPVGILAHAARSDTIDHSRMLSMGPSYNEEAFIESLFLKMEGRKLYRYALQTVAGAMKECLDRAGLAIGDVTKILLHQANGKMDEAIADAFYQLAPGVARPEGVLPMTISWLGNSSVATIPTLLDLIVKGQMENQSIRPGDLLLFASVGAGMHINAVAYRVP